MHKATCGIHADMRLVSEMPVLPFLGLVRFKGRVRGPCSSLSFKSPGEGRVHHGAALRRDPCLLKF